MRITRRTAIGAMAGTLFFPRIALDSGYENDLARLVQEFTDVGPRYKSYDLRSPFSAGGDSVATDAGALICVPGLRFVAMGRRVRVPDMNQVISKFWRDAPWRHLPPEKINRERKADCPFCVRRRCGACGGKSRPRGEPSCSRCKGRGYLAGCEWCDGRTDRKHPFIDEWEDSALNLRYARLMRRIPGARWLPPASSELPVLVRGDGGIRAMAMTLELTD